MRQSTGQSCPAVPAETQPGAGEPCGDSLWKPPQFNLQFLFLTTSLCGIWAALWAFQNPPAQAANAVVLLTWLLGCPRTRRASLLIAAAMHLPFAWIALIDYPWNEYRWMWLGMWGHGFGILPAKTVARHSDWLPPLAAAFTVGVFLGSVSILRFVPALRWWTAGTLFATASVFSFACYRGFLM